MSQRTVHILSKGSDVIPVTGDLVVILSYRHEDAPGSAPVPAAIFGAGQPSRNITEDEEAAFRTVHAVVDSFIKGTYGQEPEDLDEDADG